MSIAWTTILIIVLLLPGVFFFIGFATRERYARELIRTGAVNEIGLASLFAIFIHLGAWTLLGFIGFDPVAFFIPLVEYQNTPAWLVLTQAVPRLWPVLWYVIVTALCGLTLGCVAAWLILRGPLRFLATHKWVYQVIKSSRGRGKVVTAFVMTNTIENNKVLMYKGKLEELYLQTDGKFSYIILKNCFRYTMNFDGDTPNTGQQIPLFDHARPQRAWDYLMITGDNISNVLFDPSPEFSRSGRGSRALEEAIRRMESTERLFAKARHEREPGK